MKPSPRLARIRQDLLDAPYTICVEKARHSSRDVTTRDALPTRLVKRAHAKLYRAGLARQAAGQTTGRLATRLNNALVRAYQTLDARDPLDQATSSFEHTLASVPLQVWPDELLVGNASSHRVGAPIHPDYSGLLLTPELGQIGDRATNPMALRAADRGLLEGPVFDAWFHRSVLAWTPAYSDDPGLTDALAEGRDVVLTQIAGISHLTPNYESVLDHGLDGLAMKVARALATNDCSPTQRRYLRSCQTVLRAATAHARRWRGHASRLAGQEQDPVRAGELRDIADTLARVPHKPATTFREALQSIVLTHCMLHYESFQHGISFGRLDQILWPYLERDLGDSRLTYDDAVELLGCFLGKAAELLPLFFDRATAYFSGLSSASGITLGGRTASGADAVNLCSFAVLEAYDQMRLRQPNIHVRVHDRIDPDFMDLCHTVLSKGGGMPAFFNDQPIEDALVAAGASTERARTYSIVGCAEWGVPSCSFPAAGAGFLNLASPLELALRGGLRDGELVGAETPAPEALTTIDAVFDAFRVHLGDLVERAVRGNNAIEQAHAEHRPTPMLSTLVDGCIECGTDVTGGGALMNSAGLQGVGLAEVADSLAGLEALLATGRGTISELVGALDADFAGHARLKGFLEHAVDKFGNDGGRAEHWAQAVSQLYCRLVGAYQTRRGGPYLAGFWSMTTHQGFGRLTGALPSGRLAERPLSNGASPRTGVDRLGPTASLNSASHVTTPANGLVVNQMLDPRLVAGLGGRRLMDGLLRGYFDQGGVQVQFNVLDPDMLRAAKRDPEAHRGLVVRISGYSAYFNDLTDEMKDELIERTCGGCL